MSFEEAIEKNWETIARKMGTIQEALSWSGAGKRVTEKSAEFATSTEMQEVMRVLSDEKIKEMDRFKFSQYFAQALEGDPRKNMANFESYLQNIANDKRYPNSQWYLRIMEAVKKLRASGGFNGYVEVYTAFQQDKDQGSIDARMVINRVNKSLRALVDSFVELN